jgi:hypothetical protein
VSFFIGFFIDLLINIEQGKPPGEHLDMQQVKAIVRDELKASRLTSSPLMSSERVGSA